MNFFLFFKKPTPVTYASKINKAIVVTTLRGNKTFLVQNAPQTGGEMVFMWKKAVGRIKKEKKNLKTCLLLGVAGGDVVRLIKQAYPDCQITGVEIDPVMVKLAKSEFGLGTITSKIIVADAIAWIKKKHTERYDLVVVDLFIGVTNPKAAHEQAFLTRIKQLLAPTGIVLYNCDYQEEHRKEFARFIARCQEVFSNAEVIFRYQKNQLLWLKK